ncbi:MAG: hypothetical protein GTO14_17400 [Anaerolineales bacterium]|nr:hypothetical protein [Anaerolineales bacterium]
MTTPVGAGSDQAFALAIQSDGKILLAGLSEGSPDDEFAVVRYDTDGGLDSTFDGDGMLTTDVAANNDQSYAMAIQP